MKNDFKNDLLKDLLDDEKLESVRSQSLAMGLQVARGRRRRRDLARVVMVILPMGAGLAWWSHQAQFKPISNAARPANTTDVHQEEHVRLITKEQLFAMLGDRPIALIGPPGHQHLMLLETTGKRPGPLPGNAN